MEKKNFSFRMADGNVVLMEAHASLPSTAALAKKYAEAGYPDRYVVFSDRQTTAPITGTKLKEGLIAAGKNYGFDLHVTGMPSLFYLRIADDPSLRLHQEWIAECVKRGIFFTNHHNHFINASLTDEDIKETVEVAAEAFEVIRERHPQ